MIIALQFLAVLPFHKGIAIAKGEDGWRVIDNQGHARSKPFSVVEEFSEGLAAYLEAGKLGFLNEAGDTAIPNVFDRSYGFKEGLARVKMEDR